MNHWITSSAVRRVTVGDHTFTVKVADTPESRTVGLLGLDSADLDVAAVLFDCGRMWYTPFTADGMRFDFHIAWYDEDGGIVDAAFITKDHRGPIWPQSDYRYVLESNQEIPQGRLKL